MSNHTNLIPAGHLVTGTRILVDGESIVATVVEVDLSVGRILTDIGIVHGLKADDLVTLAVAS